VRGAHLVVVNDADTFFPATWSTGNQLHGALGARQLVRLSRFTGCWTGSKLRNGGCRLRWRRRAISKLSPGDIEALLELAREAAHGSGDRTNAPLIAYLVGLAHGRSPQTELRLVIATALGDPSPQADATSQPGQRSE
jgi:uncharacterized protein DUF6457